MVTKRLLGTTTLVHESYLRFLKNGELNPEHRKHFLPYASHVMRSIVVDSARRHLSSKRGAGLADATLNTDEAVHLTASDEQVIQLHEALEELVELEPRVAKVIEIAIRN